MAQSASPTLRHFVAYVEDQPGVLNRVTSLFRRRCYNIVSLNVGRTHEAGISRMTFAVEADAVLIGSGIRTREIADDPKMLSRISLDPSRQLIGAQCSGTLLLAKLGLIGESRRARTSRPSLG